MKNEKVLEKIKKCLRLAKSSNPHEAAAAMRQAQKLMEKYNLTERDVDLTDVEMSEHSAGTAQTPARWHQYLVNIICFAFGVKAVYIVTMTGCKVQFVGLDNQAEIAGYAYDVLFRQLRRDRNDHIATLKRCKRATKTRRGDLFAEAWVMAVGKLVNKFALNEKQSELIKQWMQTHHPDTQKCESREHKAKANDWKSQNAGYRKGREAQLNQGVNTEGYTALEQQA